MRTLGCGSRVGSFKRFLALAALFSLLLPGWSELSGQEHARNETYVFDIPVMVLSDALEAFRGVTGWTVSAEADLLVEDVTTRGVRGRLTAVEALRQLLFGTGLGITRTAEGVARLERRALVLPRIRVEAEADRGYQVDVTRTATRTETLLRDVPQSVSVVTHAIIADLQMSSMADVVEYVPGVAMGQGEGNRDQATLRGNGSTADFYVDGVRDDTEHFRDLYNVERVEVVKGSNALVFGRAAGGGGINRVSKQASWTPVREVRLEGGTHEHRRGVVDAGGGLSDQLAARVTGLYENSNSYRDGLNLERYGVTPTVTLALGSGTVVRAAYEFFNDHRTADRGVPSFHGVPLRTDPSRFFGDPDVSYADARVHAVSATIEHQIGSRVLLRNHTRFAGYRKFYQNVFPGPVNAEGTEVRIIGYNNRTWRTNVFNQTDLTGSLRTGGLRHVWVAGVEVGHQSSDAFRNTGFFHDTLTSVDVPVTAPTTVGTPVTFRQSETDADARTTALVLAGWLQDQIEISPNVLAIAGVRIDNFDLGYHNHRDDADLSRRDVMVSPRFGLVVKPTARLSVYGSYSVTHLPSSGNQFTSLNVTTETLEPEKFSSYEAGVKWDPQPGLSIAAALYQLDRTSTSAPDPADPTHTIQAGAQRSRGVEVTATGRVTRAWQALLSYDFQEVEITGRTSSADVGQVPGSTPRHTLSFWNRYEVTSSFGLGLGVLHRDEMFAAIDNTVTVPGFTRLDAGLFVRVTDRARAQINVENLADERYFASAHNNNNITPGSPRRFVAAATIGF
ncbi:MAG: TonB-dependent siderophore receptor [Longimicrobiales bacterium]